MKVVIAALIACVLVCSCENGRVAFPKTRKGWGVVVMVVGAAWILTGALIAADKDYSTGMRVGGGLGAAGLGTLLIWGGWELGDFGSKPAPASQ